MWYAKIYLSSFVGNKNQNKEYKIMDKIAAGRNGPTAVITFYKLETLKQ